MKGRMRGHAVPLGWLGVELSIVLIGSDCDSIMLDCNCIKTTHRFAKISKHAEQWKKLVERIHGRFYHNEDGFYILLETFKKYFQVYNQTAPKSWKLVAL